jgi:acetyl esterase/lipase
MLMIKIFFLILLLFMKPLIASERAWYFTSSDVNSLHSEPANARISYGNETLQFGELRLPETSGLHPVAIIIHGGCWLSTFADLKNTAALADALRKMGIATWNIEYRRIDHEGGGWPGTFKDVADAADFLRQIDKKYSLDLNKVIVIGHSSGGHLALWLAGRHRLSSTSILYREKPLSLRGVISLGGVTDLKAFRDKASSICGIDVIGRLLGGNDKRILDT